MTALQAADQAVPAAGLQPAFQYTANSALPIIEFSQLHRMISTSDTTPLLRVYGNGRVHVHFPIYMKRAGDYELYLKPVELNELLRKLADNGIMDFDPAAAKLERQQLETARRAATGELFQLSDDTDTVIKIRLNTYQRNLASPRMTGFNKEFIWRNLQHDARRYPASDRLSRAANATAILETLCSHPGLQKLP